VVNDLAGDAAVSSNPFVPNPSAPKPVAAISMRPTGGPAGIETHVSNSVRSTMLRPGLTRHSSALNTSMRSSPARAMTTFGGSRLTSVSETYGRDRLRREQRPDEPRQKGPFGAVVGGPRRHDVVQLDDLQGGLVDDVAVALDGA
jgi:hypothetical protein